MTFTKRAALAVLLVFAGLSVPTTAHASRLAAPNDCTYGYLCLYNHSQPPWSQIDDINGGVKRNTCWSLLSGAKRKTSYVYNWTGSRWFLFRDSRCLGAHIEVPPNTQGPISSFGNGWNDSVTHMMRTSQTS